MPAEVQQKKQYECKENHEGNSAHHDDGTEIGVFRVTRMRIGSGGIGHTCCDAA